MRRLLSVILFAISIFAAQSFASTPQAHAAWVSPRANPSGAHFPTPLATCHAIDFSGIFIGLFPGTTDGGPLTTYDCVHGLQLQDLTDGIFPFCGSTDLGPNPDVTVIPGGCSPAAPPNFLQLGRCGCDGDGGQSNNGAGTFVGNPININIGNKFEQVTDYESAGPNKLSFKRYYNSRSRVFSSLGLKWQSNFDRVVVGTGSTTMAMFRPDGAVLLIPFNGDTGVLSDTDVDAKMTMTDGPGGPFSTGSMFVFTDHDDTIETYRVISQPPFTPPHAVLVSIQSRDGYTQTLHYNQFSLPAILESVSDSYGRTLAFTYANGTLQTVTDPDGNVYTYNYDSVVVSGADRLKSVTYPGSSSPTVQYVYENTNDALLLTGIIDEDGNRFATFGYDASLLANSSQHAGGADQVAITYNADGSATATNALGVADTYKFATLQGMVKVTEIDRAATATTAAATRTFSYDANGYLARETDWNGNLTTYVNDTRGQVISKTEASGTSLARTTTTAYHATFHVPTQIVEPGRTTAFTYDSLGRVIAKTQTDTTTTSVPYSTNGRTRSWSYAYTATGELATVNGPLGDVTTYAYDSSGALTSVTNALSQVTQITAHTASGRPQTVVDPNGVTTTLAYDARNRLTSTSIATGSGNAVTTIAYDPAGNVTQITRPDSSFLAYTYDAAHRLTKVTDALGATITYTLDAMGDRTQTQIAASGGTVTKAQSQVFDELGRLLKNIGAASQTTIYAHDADGNVTGITDPLSQATGQSFDALNRLIQVAAPLSATTSTGYDAHDNRISTTDPRGLVTTYVYDGLDDLIEVSSPDTGIIVYVTDAAGNRTQQTDAAGNVIQLTYDLLSRVTAKTFPADAAENVAYTYDASGAGDSVGRLTSATDQTGTTSFVYDALGNVTQETIVLAGSGAASYLTAYAYDLASHVMQVTYPSGRIVTYTRDAMGRVASVATQANASASVITVASGASYEPFGPLAALSYGNGLNLSAQFDEDYQPSARSVTGSSTVQNLSYGFDAAGDLQTITDNLATARSQSLQYDALYRLTQAAGVYGTYSYGYDAVGNRTSLGLTNSGGSTSSTYSYATTSNQVQTAVTGSTTRTLSYGATGNITRDDFGNGTIYNFTYNQDNRLSRASAAWTTPYTYDFRGRRVFKQQPNFLYFHYDRGSHLIAESIYGGYEWHEYIWLDDLPLAFISFGSIDYIHTDHLGTPQKMTDGSQNIVWDGAASDPFMLGQLPASNMNLRFPGQYFDSETGLHHNGMRDYDPTLGRYIESDPIGLGGGINTYAYVGGNPVRWTDAVGLCTDPGGVGTSYCVQQYIPDPSAWGFGGDDRGPSPDGGTYRASQWIWQDPNGDFQSRSDPGTSSFGPSTMKGNQGPNSASESSCGNCKTYTLTNNTSNGFFPNGHIAPYANTTVTITECDGKVVSVSGSHSPYPNVEIWQYGNGAPKLIYSYGKGSNGPSNIAGPPVVIPGAN